MEMLVVTHVTAPSKLFSIRSLTSSNRRSFAALMAEQGRELPGYVQREFEEFLKCGRLEHGFLRVRCESCYTEHLVAFSCKRFTPRILFSVLRVSFRLFKITPGDFVRRTASTAPW